MIAVSDIISLAFPIVAQKMGRPYEIAVRAIEPNYIATIYDRISGFGVTVMWTRQQERDADSTEKKSKLAKDLIENGIKMLDEELANEDDVEDVDFE